MNLGNTITSSALSKKWKAEHFFIEDPPFSIRYDTLPSFIPSHFDGRDIWRDVLSDRVDQGNCGSCWAFAATTCFCDRVNIFLGYKRFETLSADLLVRCDIEAALFGIDESSNKAKFEEIYRRTADNAGCYGSTLLNAWLYLMYFGTTSGACVNVSDGKDPYASIDPGIWLRGSASTDTNCITSIGRYQDFCSDTFDDRKIVRGTPLQRVFVNSVYNIQPKADVPYETLIRYEIMRNGPVSTSFDMYQDFYDYVARSDPENVYIPDPNAHVVTGHSVVIIGWGELINDDGIATDYWILRNSWGGSKQNMYSFRFLRGVDACGIETNVLTGFPGWDAHYSRNRFVIENMVSHGFFYRSNLFFDTMLFKNNNYKILCAQAYDTINFTNPNTPIDCLRQIGFLCHTAVSDSGFSIENMSHMPNITYDNIFGMRYPKIWDTDFMIVPTESYISSHTIKTNSRFHIFLLLLIVITATCVFIIFFM